MIDGQCYQIYNSTTLYVFPSLSCTDGQAIPSTYQTTRETWIYNDKIKNFYKSLVNYNVSVNYNTSTQVVGHIWSNPAWYEMLSPDSLILPAVIVVLCLFKLILNMIMGVRR